MRINSIYDIKTLLNAPEGLKEEYKQAINAFIDENAFHVWGIEDVKTLRPDLSDEECINILKAVEYDCNSDLGISWDTLEAAISWREAENLQPSKAARS